MYFDIYLHMKKRLCDKMYKKSSYSFHCLQEKYHSQNLVFKQRENLSTRIICHVFFQSFTHLFYTEILFIFFQIIHYTKEISIYNFMHKLQYKILLDIWPKTVGFFKLFEYLFWNNVILHFFIPKKYLLTLRYLSKNC